MPTQIPESIEERAFGPVEFTEIAEDGTASLSLVEEVRANAESTFWWTSVVDCPTDTLANAVRVGFLTEPGTREELAGLLGEYCAAQVAGLYVNRGASMNTEPLLSPEGTWIGARVTVRDEVDTPSATADRRIAVGISLDDVEWAAAATLVGAASHVGEWGSTPLDADVLEVVVPVLAQVGDFAHAVFTPTEHDGLGGLCLAREILRKGPDQDSLHGLALLDEFLIEHAHGYCNVGTSNFHQLRARLSWAYKETPDAGELEDRLQTLNLAICFPIPRHLGVPLQYMACLQEKMGEQHQ